jgi:DNA polymerase I-like protein with 3'-5' exonuclease and polymerase domains
MIFFDLESDGFLDETSRLHCIVVIENGETYRYRGDTLEVGLNHIMTADKAVAHNGIKFDIPVIKKLYPWFNIEEDRVLDTLVMSRLIYADLTEVDTKLLAKGKLPKEQFRSHSLKAWGYRLGEHKGDPSCGFDVWSQELEDYCVQDVVVLEKLYQHLISKEPSPASIELEHKVAWIIAEQERTGFMFDVKKAEALHVDLMTKKLELEAQLQQVFPPWFTKVETKEAKVNNSKTGVTKGVTYTKVVQQLFNPQSRQHIADRLMKLRGWVPTEFTPSGQPKVDETTISQLDYPEAKPLAEYLLISKRIAQLAEGDQAWLKQVKNDGRIHGSVITNGAVTGRATHNNPNVAQVPSCGSPYGSECRSLFRVPTGKRLVGADLSGLELRCLAHYMGQFDQGDYSRVLLEGDVHTANQQAAGLETRAQAKTFIYGFLYGAGAAKIGSIVGKGAKEGQQLKDRFLAKTPALKKLVTGVQKFAEKNGYLPGLDKRKLFVRSSHAALNTLLQSAGALIAKQALVEFKQLLISKGYQERAKLVAWVHDEIQVETDEEIADEIGQLAVRSFELAGEHFNFRCPITGEYKVGTDWASTH